MEGRFHCNFFLLLIYICMRIACEDQCVLPCICVGLWPTKATLFFFFSLKIFTCPFHALVLSSNLVKSHFIMPNVEDRHFFLLKRCCCTPFPRPNMPQNTQCCGLTCNLYYARPTSFMDLSNSSIGHCNSREGLLTPLLFRSQ